MNLSKTTRNWLIGGAIVLILVLWGIGSYNNFVQFDVNVQTGWAQVETQYQRRFDLIPNLVESVRGALAQEQKIFQDLAEARTRYAGAVGKNQTEAVAAANQLESAFARLLVIMENYPQLRSIETVQGLMSQLEGTENRIAVARERYNESVQILNTRVRSFPSNLIAKVFGFKQKEMFKSVQDAEKSPKVDLIN